MVVKNDQQKCVQTRGFLANPVPVYTSKVMQLKCIGHEYLLQYSNVDVKQLCSVLATS